jgi:hypothetical protein
VCLELQTREGGGEEGNTLESHTLSAPWCDVLGAPMCVCLEGGLVVVVVERRATHWTCRHVLRGPGLTGHRCDRLGVTSGKRFAWRAGGGQVQARRCMPGPQPPGVTRGEVGFGGWADIMAPEWNQRWAGSSVRREVWHTPTGGMLQW